MLKIVRAHGNADSTVMIDKRILHDVNLSWEAKGLMAYLETLPEGTDIQLTELSKSFNDNPDTIQSAMKELVKHGYLTEHA